MGNYCREHAPDQLALAVPVFWVLDRSSALSVFLFFFLLFSSFPSKVIILEVLFIGEIPNHYNNVKSVIINYLQSSTLNQFPSLVLN